MQDNYVKLLHLQARDLGQRDKRASFWALRAASLTPTSTPCQESWIWAWGPALSRRTRVRPGHRPLVYAPDITASPGEIGDIARAVLTHFEYGYIKRKSLRSPQ